MLDMYGLMSRIGVPSSMSTPWTCSEAPSRRRSSTTVSAIGFGRNGERVAKTPCGDVFAGRRAEELETFRTIEDPDDEEMREAFDVREAGFELRQDFENAIRLVLRAGTFRHLHRFLERSPRESDRAGVKSGWHHLVSHNARIGTAKKPSRKLAVVSPS